MSYINHMLFGALLALKSLITNQTFSLSNLTFNKFSQSLNIQTLICKWWKVMNCFHMLFWISNWTKNALIFLFISDNRKLWTGWCVTLIIMALWILNKFFSVRFMFLGSDMLFICLNWKKLFWAKFTIKLFLSAAFCAGITLKF